MRTIFENSLGEKVNIQVDDNFCIFFLKDELGHTAEISIPLGEVTKFANKIIEEFNNIHPTDASRSKLINTPVRVIVPSYNSKLKYEVIGHSGGFLFACSNRDIAEEIVKKINAYDPLIKGTYSFSDGGRNEDVYSLQCKVEYLERDLINSEMNLQIMTDLHEKEKALNRDIVNAIELIQDHIRLHDSGKDLMAFIDEVLEKVKG